MVSIRHCNRERPARPVAHALLKRSGTLETLRRSVRRHPRLDPKRKPGNQRPLGPRYFLLQRKISRLLRVFGLRKEYLRHRSGHQQNPRPIQPRFSLGGRRPGADISSKRRLQRHRSQHRSRFRWYAVAQLRKFLERHQNAPPRRRHRKTLTAERQTLRASEPRTSRKSRPRAAWAACRLASDRSSVHSPSRRLLLFVRLL